jgi:hypothetical protein
LGFRAESKERDLDGGVGDAESSGHGGVNAGDLFEHEDVGDGVEAGTAPLFGHEHAAAAESAEFPDDLEGKVISALPVFDMRPDFGGHELTDSVANEELVVGEGEVHGRSFSFPSFRSRVQVESYQFAGEKKTDVRSNGKLCGGQIQGKETREFEVKWGELGGPLNQMRVGLG